MSRPVFLDSYCVSRGTLLANESDYYYIIRNQLIKRAAGLCISLTESTQRAMEVIKQN